MLTPRARMFMRQLRAAASRDIPREKGESFDFVDLGPRALPEDDMFVFAERQLQKPLGDRIRPPGREQIKRRGPRDKARSKRIMLSRLCLGLSRKGLRPASSKAIVCFAPSREGENMTPAHSIP